MVGSSTAVLTDLPRLSSPLAKNISLSSTGKSSLQARPVSRPSEGRLADRHGRWARDAMDAGPQLTSEDAVDGEVVWA